jgi:hypothetical protein
MEWRSADDVPGKAIFMAFLKVMCSGSFIHEPLRHGAKSGARNTRAGLANKA